MSPSGSSPIANYLLLSQGRFCGVDDIRPLADRPLQSSSDSAGGLGRLIAVPFAGRSHFLAMPSGNAKGAMVLLLLLLFCTFMQSAITSVTMFILAEIFPLRVRGITMGLCIAIIWVTKFAYGLLLPLAMDFLGISATFLLLLFFTALSTIFVWLFLPETREKTLEEMEKQFRAEDWTALKRKGRKRSKQTRKTTEDGESGERSKETRKTTEDGERS
ncbi:hypothetical protein niasHS_012930 [Heterodera schachtii]|uniref:Major facilitator superfamily (MFS) profile domain-containing protein n=1 Tax=Heterodera schachtii TaxID=97005 RepID=A0ABD2IXE0_HETSC